MFSFFGSLASTVKLLSIQLEPFWQTNGLDNAELLKRKCCFSSRAWSHCHKIIYGTFTVSLGGSGSTLIVLILIMVIMTKKQYKEVGTVLAIAPGIFNVNEPVIFGLPMVMNASLFNVCGCLRQSICHHCLCWICLRHCTVDNGCTSALDDALVILRISCDQFDYGQSTSNCANDCCWFDLSSVLNDDR